VLGVELSRPYYPDPHTFFGAEVSMREQTRGVAARPGRFLEGVGGAVACGGPTYHRLYVLGWLDTRLTPTAVVLHTLVLAWLAVASRSEVCGVVRLPRWPAALAVTGAMGLVLLSLYLWCTPVGSPTVAGVHGRYLLPLLPAALLLAPGVAPRLIPSPRVQEIVAAWAAGVAPAVAAAAVVERYYLPGGGVWAGGAPALVGGLLIALGSGVISLRKKWPARLGCRIYQ
jgi:hypothetical protein